MAVSHIFRTCVNEFVPYLPYFLMIWDTFVVDLYVVLFKQKKRALKDIINLTV
jgi:hypothetical protein